MEAVNRKIRVLCVVFLGAALSIAARIGDAGTGEVIRAQDEYTASTETGYADTETGTDEAVRNLGAFTPPAELHYVETDARQEGNELIFGNLVLELPEGVFAETAAEAGMGLEVGLTIDLDGAEQIDENFDTGPFPPRIGMARYTAKYECEEALVCALLTLFPGGNLQIQHEDRENNKYFIAIQSVNTSGYEGYALVRGEELYLVCEFELESGYSFFALRRNGRVKWQDSGEAIEDEWNVDDVYFQVTPEEDISLLCQDGPTGWSFYQKGYFDNCYTSIETDDSGSFVDSRYLTDINFDRYTDISLHRNRAMIWEPGKKEYIKVQYPIDMPDPVFWESFPETKTIWAYACDYLSEPHNSSNMDYTESLWQWEDFTPVKRGECTAEVREDGVRIRAYGQNASELLFDASYTLEEWEDIDNESIRSLYRQFYDGRIPEDSSFVEEIDGYRPRGFLEGQEIIPQGLLDEITASVNNDTELETLKARMDVVWLTKEECYAVAMENDDIRSDLLMCYLYKMMRADIDNDGIEDIIGLFHEGGSDHVADYVLFQGQTDGTYIQTDYISSLWEGFGVIEYGGKNYLVRLLDDYDMQPYDGVSVMAFDEGRCAEEKIIECPVDERGGRV